MKKLVFILILIGLCSQSHDLYSQNSRIKFVGLTLLVANHASLSYEYALTKNHAIGIQFSGNLLINPFTYYATTYRRSSVHINYRYYFLLKSRLQFFGQLEFGFTKYKHGDVSKYYYAKELGGGPLFGLRKSIGSTDKWFVDLAVGFNIINRDYYKVNVDWDLRCETTDHEGHDHILPELPVDKTMLKPRVVLEFGFKF